MGVITYVLLSGLSPFLGADHGETFDNITGLRELPDMMSAKFSNLDLICYMEFTQPPYNVCFSMNPSSLSTRTSYLDAPSGMVLTTPSFSESLGGPKTSSRLSWSSTARRVPRRPRHWRTSGWQAPLFRHPPPPPPGIGRGRITGRDLALS